MRVKRGITANRRHKKTIKAAKGMQASRRSSYRLAKQAVIRALQYAYRDRRNKKRDLRSLWIARINAAARANGITYGQLISKLKKNKVILNRKVLADLAAKEPKVFSDITKDLT